jgi:hypothetical protein
MGRATLIVILGIMGIFSFTQLTLNQNTNISSENAIDLYSKQVARNIANSTVNRLKAYLNNNSGYRLVNYVQEDIFDGYVQYNIQDTSVGGINKVVINAIGGYMDNEVSIIAVLELPENGSIPEYLEDYALICNRDFNQTSGVFANCCNSNINSNIYVGGNFNQSNSGSILGFVKYVGSFCRNGIINPPDNPSGLPESQNIPSLTIQPWDIADFTSSITQTFSTGLTINSAFALGTSSSPEIIHVVGDLTINSSAELNGFGLFLVEGHVFANGGVNIPTMDANKINVAIYSTLNMVISNGSYPNIMFYTNSDFQITNASITGLAISINNSEMVSGALYHKGANSILLPPSMVEERHRTKIISCYE